MNLSFEIREHFLIASALFRENKEDIGWKEFKNYLWGKYRESYEFFLHYEPDHFFSQPDPIQVFDKVNNQISDLLREVLASSEFKDLYKKTESYKEWLSGEWESKKAKVEEALKSILRIDLSNREVKVLVVHPSVGGGKHIGQGLILWGGKEYWPNYNVVYLAHEFMHEILCSADIQHAVIELITDNELRIRLNGEGSYFKEGHEEVGHSSLRMIEEKLLPHWKEYLLNPKQNIFDFIKMHERKTEYIG